MNGVINVYKPVGCTSFDVVAALKKICNTGKVGHTGTLDPLASGVLPVCIGKATKIVDYIMEDIKIYKTQLKLGITTDTYDLEGKVTSSKDVDVNDEEILKVIKKYLGQTSQIPPMYSAIKVNGKKLYDLARAGIEIERKGRLITIYDIYDISISLPYVNFVVKCSKGTYIRSLCYDIGRDLNCGAVMTKLERIRSGIFSIENSINIQSLNAENVGDYLISIENALEKYKKINLDKRFKKLLINGVKMNDPALIDNVDENVIYRVYSDNDFIGLGLRTSKEFKIIKLLNTG
ncbi:tRNA pseudouridine(55) synthase TruB [Clostridium sp. JN-9]|uniref:tRNA pseudouridine(55) synthase TruB n=1 Tax=Clostridium sp. JN-9 TaxID=2507159 RepID=UPI000FFE25BE|nr:tRNA pseudouridine(55) synthase TruB [Clostridium sp. JN-9]QAT40206.1 tRNA pseudouridine(55) synthase TruB [Clostridium sp. JN-9]